MVWCGDNSMIVWCVVAVFWEVAGGSRPRHVVWASAFRQKRVWLRLVFGVAASSLLPPTPHPPSWVSFLLCKQRWCDSFPHVHSKFTLFHDWLRKINKVWLHGARFYNHGSLLAESATKISSLNSIKRGTSALWRVECSRRVASVNVVKRRLSASRAWLWTFFLSTSLVCGSSLYFSNLNTHDIAIGSRRPDDSIVAKYPWSWFENPRAILLTLNVI